MQKGKTAWHKRLIGQGRRYFLLFAVMFTAVLPLFLCFIVGSNDRVMLATALVFNFAMWLLVILWSTHFEELQVILREYSLKSHLEVDLRNPFQAFHRFLEDIAKKERALSLRLHVSQGAVDNALFKNINLILDQSRTILDVTGAEFTLVDRETGQFHGSFISGRPFRMDMEMALKTAEREVGLDTAVRPPEDLPLEMLTTTEGNSLVVLVPLQIAGTRTVGTTGSCSVYFPCISYVQLLSQTSRSNCCDYANSRKKRSNRKQDF